MHKLLSCTLNLKQCQITLIAARWASWFHFIQPNFAKVIQLYPPFDQCQITLIAARWDGLPLCTFTQPKFVKKYWVVPPLWSSIKSSWSQRDGLLHCIATVEHIYLQKMPCPRWDSIPVPLALQVIALPRTYNKIYTSLALPTELMEISNTMVPITLDMGELLLHHYTQPKLCTKAFPAMYIQKFGLCFENR